MVEDFSFGVQGFAELDSKGQPPAPTPSEQPLQVPPKAMQQKGQEVPGNRLSENPQKIGKKKKKTSRKSTLDLPDLPATGESAGPNPSTQNRKSYTLNNELS